MTPDTLWFTRCPAPSAASIAIRNGWLEAEFAPDGITVASLASSTNKSVHLSHYQHTQPNSFRFGGYVPPLVTRSRGTDVRLIGLAAPDRTAEVVVPAHSPIRHGADLRGCRLGVPRRLHDSIDWWRATVLAGYDTALAATGLAHEDVQFVEIDVARAYVEDVTLGHAHAQSLWGARSQFAVQREEAAAMIRGEVDALYTDAAMGAILKAAYGFRAVVDVSGSEDGSRGSNGFPVVLTVSGGLLDARPDLVARWVRRLLDADAWGRANEAEAKRILARDTGVPEDFLDLSYSPRVHCQLDVSLSEARIALLRGRHDNLLAHGFLAAPIDFDRFIDPAPLQRALEWQRERGR
jgi:ABC-type nitrate/sulfonate/bicarbonate transport system substrate-binding protein